MKTFYKILFAMIFLFPVITADGQNLTGYPDKSSPQTLHNSKYQVEISVTEIPDELSKSKGANTLSRDAKARYTGWENDPDSLDVYIDDNWTEEEKDSVRAGIARWNAAGCEPALRESSTSSGAEITIAKSSSLPDNNAGSCRTIFDSSSGKNISCEIQVNDDTSPLSIKEVVAHELGHALGLKYTDAEADDNVGDVMFAIAPLAHQLKDKPEDGAKRLNSDLIKAQNDSYSKTDTIIRELDQSRDPYDWYKGWVGDPDSITVYIDPNFTTAQKAEIQAAIDRWNNEGCVPALKTVTTSPANVNITRNDALGGGGKCTLYGNAATGEVSRAEIEIDTDGEPGYANTSVGELTTHELGHALGLDHTNNAADVMKPVGSNGNNGALSAEDKRELQRAGTQAVAYVPPDKAEAPANAMAPGESQIVSFELVDYYPPEILSQTYAEVYPFYDPQLFVDFAEIDFTILNVAVTSDITHPNSTMYLMVELFPPAPYEPVSFLGYHFIHTDPVDPVAFECPFEVIQEGENVYVDWTDMCTYPFENNLRSKLTIDGDIKCLVKEQENYNIQLSPGMHTLELTVDDFQVNSASYNMEVFVESTTPPWEDGFEIYPLNTDIVGQGGWEFWFGGESSPSARVTEEQVHTGELALKILGKPDMTGDDIVHQFSECNSGKWNLKLWQYISPFATTGSTYITLLNDYGYTMEECNWSTQLMFNAADGIVESQFEGAQLPLVKGEWVPLEILLDFDNDLQTINYNGEMLTSKSWTEGLAPAGNMELAALNLFSGDMTQVVYYDDISLLPEDNFGLEDMDAFQISYDWGDWSEENSRVGLLSCKYTPQEQATYLNAFTVNNNGEIYWVGQNYLPSAEFSSVVQKTTILFDLEPLGISPGITLESLPLWITINSEPVNDLALFDLPDPATWPEIMVSTLVDNTYNGWILNSSIPGYIVEPPFFFDPNWWDGIFDEFVYRGCNVPEFDLDYTNHPAVAGGYAGDSNACAPAAVSSSLEWLEDVYEDSVPNCNNNQTHREVLEDLSNQMNRQPNQPPPTWTDYIGGKLKYTQKHKLPIRTKFQLVTNDEIAAGADIRPPGSNYEADNQTGPTGMPDWNWLVNEMNNGEDVEINVNFWDGTKWNGGHVVVCTGLYQTGNGSKGIWFKHDRDQKVTDADSVLQEPSEILEGGGWLRIPKLNGPAGTAYVTNFLSESYDNTVDYEKASGTLEDSDGNPVDPTKCKIKARLWNNPDDSLSSSSGTIKYKIIGGKGFWDIDYDDFETPPQPGDRIVVTFWDGEKWVTKVFRVPEDGGPIYEDVTIEDQMIVHLDFTEWIQITIPPHKTLKVHWDSVTGCGNADIVQWNGEDWYVPSYGHWNFNPTCTVKEISNDTDAPQYKRFHCDDPNGFYLDFSLVESTGVTTGSNQSEYATVNLGGMDMSNDEFGDIIEVQYDFNYETNAQLGEFPGTIGEEGVQELSVNFESFDNIYWEDMMLTIDVADVWQEGFLEIELDGNPDKALAPIIPGVPTVTVNIGAVLPAGIHTLTLTAISNVFFDIDCFNITTMVPIPTENYDLGDCPDDPYPTLLANDGARHMVDNLTYLGALIDAEADGQPNATATGDDISNLADEDGITFGPIMPGSPAQITIDPKINPDPDLVGFLQGWIDFNRDGDWDDPGEQIFKDEVLHFSSPVCLLYNVPANVTAGSVYARFRFSTVPGLNYFGPAPDGEVEDYLVEVVEDQGMKWLQEPCPELSGLHCHDYVSDGEYNYTTIADDWQCNGGMVTDIHWWGNYENVGSGIDHFHLSIHETQPDGCLPMQQEIWGMDVPLDMANETLWSGQIFSYEYVLDVPFEQVEGKTYWLDITAYANDPLVPAIWRWQESDRSTVPYHILCPAVSRSATNPLWNSIIWTDLQPVRYSQMAFAITSIAEIDIDFGDAPDDPYPTLLASNGARHLIDGITYLGDLIDAEANGQPNISATGDDIAISDDEDGVVFRGPLVAGSPTILKVKASVDGKLNVWLDVNRNGFWGDPSDHVFVDYNLVAGWNSLILNVPANTKVGISYMRFRFSQEGGETYYGPSTYGEVEDYLVKVYPENWGFIPTPTTHTILVPLNVLLTNTTLAANDAIGVWYEDDNGNMVCGGAEIWDGATDRIVLAYADDNTTPDKDGFDDGEILTWKIYHTGLAADEVVSVLYDATFPQSDGKFTSYGLSKLTEINGLSAIAIASPAATCAGDPVQLDVIVTGGSGNYTYSWSSNPTGFTSNLKNPVDNPVQDIVYTVVVDDGVTSVNSSVGVSVQAGPTADAGSDATICETETYQLDATATNYATLQWTTDGEGVFNDATAEDPIYIPGANDIAHGNVILTLTAFPILPCTNVASSSMELTFTYNPIADAGTDGSVCADGTYQLDGEVGNSNVYYWSTAGDGTFDDSTLLDAMYAPGSGDAQAGQVTLTLTANAISPCQIDATASMTLIVLDTQKVSLFTGWNGLSSYLSPINQNNNYQLFSSVLANLVLVYNFDGTFWPDQGTNSLVWDEESGYVIKLETDDEMIFCGDDLASLVVNLNENWNIIPVLSDTDVDVSSVFDASVDVKLVLEVAGWKLFWPEYNINSILNLETGKSYFVFMNAAGSIDYANASNKSGETSKPVLITETPWNEVNQSPAGHVVAFTGAACEKFVSGDVIGAFTNEGLCAGISPFEAVSTGIILKGDDPYNWQADGFANEETVAYKLYRPTSGELFDMQVSYDPGLDHSGRYHDFGMSAVTGLKLQPTGISDHALSTIRIYPNPSHGIFNIDGISGETAITVYDAYGNMIREMITNEKARINLSEQADGIYLVKVKTLNGTHYQKVVIN